MKGSDENFYITTTLPYVNASPHMGHALEFVRADTIARYKEMMGAEVILNTGNDEHGLKIYRKSTEEGRSPQEYVDYYSSIFRELTTKLGMKKDLNFIRTTDLEHKKVAQEFWKRCLEKGDIYKKKYKINYCVGCELEKSLSELIDGQCPDHPGRETETIEEENYFFRFSQYQKDLLNLYDSNPKFVVPDFRLKEIKRFVERGLQDFSISRLAKKQPWGVSVPNDPEHTMYVWFDALVNYVSVLGWPEDKKNFKKWWPVIQYAGKDNLRQQAAMWQAMLMSVGLPPSKQIIINGFIISGGRKMSKSVGNVIDPLGIIKKYGTDALRYYVLRDLHPFEDSDMTEGRFKEVYNANLANGLGNVCGRVLKMMTAYEVGFGNLPNEKEVLGKKILEKDYHGAFSVFEINKASDTVWKKISKIDKDIDETQPFKTIKTDSARAKSDVVRQVHGLWEVAVLLGPMMPETTKKIKEAIKRKSVLKEALFPRIE